MLEKNRVFMNNHLNEDQMELLESIMEIPTTTPPPVEYGNIFSIKYC